MKRPNFLHKWILLLCAVSVLLLSACRKTDKQFSIIILPDTQIYAYNDPAWRNSSRKEVYTQMTRWIVTNTEELNIKFVLHMGDIVQVNSDPDQWINADEAMSLLDGVVPYCFTIGNHDMVLSASEGSGIVRDSTNFNNTFPYTRYESEPWYGGRMLNDGYPPTNNYDNSYHFFSAAGMDFMIINVEVNPTDAMLAWADGIISANSDCRVIFMTHSYMNWNDTRDNGYVPYLVGVGPPNSGEEVWQECVKKHENIFFVFSGHHDIWDIDYKGLLASTGDNGNTVYQLLSGKDYDGWLRILTFVPEEDKIYVKSYSPWQPDSPSDQFRQYPFSLPGYNPDPYNQYELTYDMD